MQEIIFDIDKSGNVRSSVKGVEGADCTALTADVEAALGTVEKTTKTPEYHHRRKATNKVGR